VADTIQEFLASLSFKVDENGLRRFNESLAGAAKGAAMLGGAIVGAVSATVIGVERMASVYEKLYYLSQRSNSTVENIRATQFGFEQIGLSAGDAASAIEGIASAMRSNPGMEGLLRGLGVQTRTANGALRDTSQVATDLVERLSKMPFFVAKQYAAMFGISEQALLQIEQNLGRLKQSEADYHETARAAGVDVDKFAADSVTFMNELRRIGTDVELAFMSVVQEILPDLNKGLADADVAIRSHFGDIKAFGLEVKDAFHGAFVEGEHVETQLDQLVKGTIGWQHALEAVAAVITYRIFGPLGVAVLALEKLDSWRKGGGKGGWFDWFGLGSPSDDNPDAPQLSQQPGFGDQKSFEEYHQKRVLEEEQKNKDRPWYDPRRWFGSDGYEPTQNNGGLTDPANPGASTRGVRNNNPLNLSYLPGQEGELGRESGANHQFGVFKDMASGIAAEVKQLWRYEERGLNTVRGIVGRWVSDPNFDDTGYVKDVAKSIGVSPDAVIDLHDAKTAAAYIRAAAKHESGAVPDADIARGVAQALGNSAPSGSGNLADQIVKGMQGVRNGDADGAVTSPVAPVAPIGSERNGGDRHVNQVNNVTVHGVPDAVRTASEVEAAQRRSNADLMRNFSGAWVA
jgi:hypothetical protein